MYYLLHEIKIELQVPCTYFIPSQAQDKINWPLLCVRLRDQSRIQNTSEWRVLIWFWEGLCLKLWTPKATSFQIYKSCSPAFDHLHTQKQKQNYINGALWSTKMLWIVIGWGFNSTPLLMRHIHWCGKWEREWALAVGGLEQKVSDSTSITKRRYTPHADNWIESVRFCWEERVMFWG